MTVRIPFTRLELPGIAAFNPNILRADLITGPRMKFNIKMKKAALLAQIKDNKVNHLKTLKKAMKAWRKQVTEACEGLDVTCTEGNATEADICDELDVLSELRREVPRNMSNTYDNAIAMVEAHSGATIELVEEDFQQLVQDNWSWKQNWESNVSTYVSI
jgi:hypothetical protein